MVDSDKDRIKDITVTGPNNETRIAQIKDLGVPTASAAINLRKEYDLDIYALGVGFETDFVGGHESLAAKSRYVRLPYNDNYLRMEARNLMLNITGKRENYFLAQNAVDIQTKLRDITKKIKYSIPNGEVHDIIGEDFNLIMDSPDSQMPNGGLKVHYPWTQGNPDDYDIVVTMDNRTLREEQRIPDLKNRIEVKFKDGQIHLENLELIGTGNWVNIEYNVQIDTEKEGFDPDKLYQTNGRTVLAPDIINNPDKKLDFYVPSARAETTEVEVEKIWERVQEEPIKLKLEKYKYTGEDYLGEATEEAFSNPDSQDKFIKDGPDTVISLSGEGGIWSKTFKDFIKFDRRGNDYVFRITEVIPAESSWETEYSVHKTEDSYMLTVKNIGKYKPNMPNTGGKGNNKIYLLGAAFLTFSSVFIVKKYINY